MVTIRMGTLSMPPLVGLLSFSMGGPFQWEASYFYSSLGNFPVSWLFPLLQSDLSFCKEKQVLELSSLSCLVTLGFDLRASLSPTP